jgi:hypothetical protein
MNRRTVHLLVALASVALAAILASPALAHDGRPHPVAPLTKIPADRPAQGMVYRGLELGGVGACNGAFRLRNSDACTHGPDEAPAGFDVKTDVVPILVGPVTPAPHVQCHSDGVYGKRVQVVYVREAGDEDRYAEYLNSFRQWAVDADTIYRNSAGETYGERHIRFVHDANCIPSVANVVVPAGALDSLGETQDALKALGYDRTDRKYMIFADANVYCGIGNIKGDDSPGAANLNNGGPSYGRTDAGCWGGKVAAHELMHNLGGVQLSAPNTSGGWHCVDEYDRMCYSDTPFFPAMQIVCADSDHNNLFDCGHDDYFHTNPSAANYLATHWNSADSAYLVQPSQPVWGYVWANNAASASYTPSLQYQRTSTGGVVTITRSSAGKYSVRFGGLGVYYGGTVNVTAHGAGPEQCKVGNWSPSLADMVVAVNCFDAAGAAADSTFVATFTRPLWSDRFAHLWSNSASPALNVAYTPSTTYQFNSEGGNATVTRTAVGAYSVKLPGQGGAGGTVKVTAYGSSSDTCKVTTWYSLGADEVIGVVCQDAAGAPADEQFTLTFHGETGILGIATDSGYERGYVWANNASSASYTPSLSYQYNSDGNTNTATRSAVGVYQVQFPGLGGFIFGRGHAQVTTYGAGTARCKVQSWSASANVNVLCFDATGAPADSRFNVDFVD